MYLLILAPKEGDNEMMNFYGWHHIHPVFGNLFWIGFVFHLLFWALFILLIVVFVKDISSKNNKDDDYLGDDEEKAISILKKRYASGELTKKEFESMKKDIS